jgi:hypothetical protein
MSLPPAGLVQRNPSTLCSFPPDNLQYNIEDDTASICQNDKVDHMSELIVRPSHNDHRLIDTLLSGAGGVRQLRPIINRLVLDAHLAAKQPAFAQAAENSGVALLIDPLTFFLQDKVRTDDPWQSLPFARSIGLSTDQLTEVEFQRDLVSQVVQFEVAYGATGVVAPYLLIGDDPSLIHANMCLIRSTRQFMDRMAVDLPLVTVIAVNASGMTKGPLSPALDELAKEACEVGANSIALAISGTGGSDDGPDRVHLLLRSISRLTTFGLPVIAWRQGQFGTAAVAAGAIGYECGIGTRERCDLVSLQRSRRPGPPRPGFAPPAGVFIQPLSKSFPRKVAQALLDDQKLRPRLVCDNEQCCSDGVASMMKDPRRHAVLARCRQLAGLDAMPSRDWKLNAVAREAESGAIIAELATRVLRDQGRKETVGSRSLSAVAIATDLLREEKDRVAS